MYLPFWAGGRIGLDENGRYQTGPSPYASSGRGNLNPKKPVLGDANPESIRGDGDCSGSSGSSCESCLDDGDDCSYVDAGEADLAGPGGFNGNRFDDRHSGGVNYLFGDFQQRLFVNDGRSILELRVAGATGPGILLLGFARDASGELYVLGNTTGAPRGTTGIVLKIVSP